MSIEHEMGMVDDERLIGRYEGTKEYRELEDIVSYADSQDMYFSHGEINLLEALSGPGTEEDWSSPSFIDFLQQTHNDS